MRLTSKAALEGERKQVTVLFADLKGSMELIADRDPEEAGIAPTWSAYCQLPLRARAHAAQGAFAMTARRAVSGFAERHRSRCHSRIGLQLNPRLIS
jgi:hypothetical protein